jgi:acyl-coenzyme A thioesterase PaaI-like protein
MTPAELLETVPFAASAGLIVVHAEPGHAVVRIPNDRRNQNHVGTVHAAALALVGETAGGLALLGHPKVQGLLLLAKGLQIRYRRPASAAANASARFSEAELDAALATMATAGKVDLPLRVEVKSDEGELLCELTIDFHLRPKAAT